MKEIDWDAEIHKIEENYMEKLWNQIPRHISKKDAKIFRAIAEEQKRTDPDGERAIDHEEIWRYENKYITFKKNA